MLMKLLDQSSPQGRQRSRRPAGTTAMTPHIGRQMAYTGNEIADDEPILALALVPGADMVEILSTDM